MACLHERRFLFCFDVQAKRLLWFSFSTSTHAKGKADNKAVDQNTGCRTHSSTEGNHLSLPPGQTHCFRLGCFSTMLYQIISAAQGLEEVRVTEIETFVGISKACAKSPTEAQGTETPMGQ